MLFRIDNPRLVVNAQEFPANVVIYCIEHQRIHARVDVSYCDSTWVTETIHPIRSLDIHRDLSLHEYVVPFFDLTDSLGRRGATHGFIVNAYSAYRVSTTAYGSRIFQFVTHFPPNGGGIIQFSLGETNWDLSNPTFNPKAPVPDINPNYTTVKGNYDESGPPGVNNLRVPDEVLVQAYLRVHPAHRTNHEDLILQRRNERLANFDLKEEKVGVHLVNPEAPTTEVKSRIERLTEE